METLLYFQSTATTSAQDKLDGIVRAARARDWSVTRFDFRDPKQVAEQIAYWNPVGCIIEFASDDLPLSRRQLQRVPTVLLDCNPAWARRGIATVTQHPTATGTLAAEHLLRLDLPRYAYVGFPESKFWDRARRTAFLARIRAAGRPVTVITPQSVDISSRNLRQDIGTELKRLPTPIGVYCPTDTMAFQLAEAAREAGLRVPEDVALIGTDNETHICESAKPTLSSVALDFVSAGIQSVEMIEAMIRVGTTTLAGRTFGPSRVIERTSTRRSKRPDRDTYAALDFIRAHALEGLSPQAVLARFSCSRRLAEERFRALTGHSVLDEIHAIQIAHAQELLAKPTVKISSIPSLCGYRSEPFFYRLFKRLTGATMQAWRNHNLGTSEG